MREKLPSIYSNSNSNHKFTEKKIILIRKFKIFFKTYRFAFDSNTKLKNL